MLLACLTLTAGLLPSAPANYPRPSLPTPLRRLRAVLAVSSDVVDAEMLEELDVAAIALDKSVTAVKPTRGKDGRLQPVLTLPGDTLQTSTAMVALTATSTALAFGIVVRAFATSSTPLGPLLGVSLGFVAGELFTGAFHWATDNCACRDSNAPAPRP